MIIYSVAALGVRQIIKLLGYAYTDFMQLFFWPGAISATLLHERPVLDSLSINVAKSNLITYITEYIIALFDVGFGYILATILSFGVGIAFILVVTVFLHKLISLNERHKRFNQVAFDVFMFLSWLALLYVLPRIVGDYFIENLLYLVFACPFESGYLRLSVPITRLTEFFIQIGSAPSLAKIGSGFLTITAFWASIEGAAGMYKYAKRKINSWKSKDDSNEIKQD